MSISTIETIMERIKAATKESPIAVFKTINRGRLDAVFWSTVVTKRCYVMQNKFLVGVYDNTMSQVEIQRKLIKAVA